MVEELTGAFASRGQIREELDKRLSETPKELDPDSWGTSEENQHAMMTLMQMGPGL